MNRRSFLKLAGLGIMGTIFPFKMKSKPNIIFMLSDDQAWNGLSVAMHDKIPGSRNNFVKTPNLEKLASQGMRFSAAYAPAPVCSPTRCSLQNGKSPAQNCWTKASPIMTANDGYKLIPPMHGKNFSSKETTIAQMLKQAGYATAHFGKWHLGGGGPGRYGYDTHDGDTGNGDAAPFKDPNPVDIFGMSKRAVEFMEKNKKAKKPFFIQLSYHALHYPENCLKETLNSCQERAKEMRRIKERQLFRAAIAQDLDTGVGKIMEGLEKLGLGENTYLIYMSDNGASAKKTLKGSKGSLWEGGIRTPLIIRGPGIKKNVFCHTRVVGYDLFPTFCELGGVKRSLPKGLEGGSIVPLFSEDKGVVKRPREELVFHFPHYQSEEGPHSCIMLGDFKLIKIYETNQLLLYNLSSDISETNDLSKEKPEKTAELHGMLVKYLKEVGAQTPKPNPKYDPENPPVPKPKGWDKGKGKKRRKKD